MFADNYKKLAKNNTNFRQVLKTGQYSQVVAMSLPAGGDIGEEVHQTTDQIFITVDGRGEAIVADETRPIEKKELVFVPAGTTHNIKNTGHEDLKLITIYAPPAHPDGEVQATKEASDATTDESSSASGEPAEATEDSNPSAEPQQ